MHENISYIRGQAVVCQAAAAAPILADIQLIQEAKMSVCSNEVMTNHHPSIAHPVAYIADVLTDMATPLSRSDGAGPDDRPVTSTTSARVGRITNRKRNKPFWRA